MVKFRCWAKARFDMAEISLLEQTEINSPLISITVAYHIGRQVLANRKKDCGNKEF